MLVVSMRKAISAIGFVSALVLSPIVASASTLTLTGVSGVWSAWTGGSRVTSTVNNDDVAQLRWGRTSGAKSGYDFAGITPGVAQQKDTIFDIGTFTHLNNVISTGTSISAAVLDVTFEFFLGNDSSQTYTRTSQFIFDHFETNNGDRICADKNKNYSGNNINGCADLVQARVNPNSTESFEIVEGGVSRKYVFDVTGFDIGNDFWTVERRNNTSVLQGRFTYQENILGAKVPLPASGLLLFGALGGLAAARRRHLTA